MFGSNFKKPGMFRSAGSIVATAGVTLAALLNFIFPAFAQDGSGSGQPIPILAYYYIWFEQNSWNRAKTDYPILGNYSSDDRLIMEQHVDWAKESGIDGFIVSWKHTDVLDLRLAQLIDVAAEKDFKLLMIYQGLDFERDPLPAARVRFDMRWFIEHYGDHPVFDMFGKPVMIWSGTWKFSEEDIALVADSVRDSLLLLGTERNVDGYLRLANYMDGNAYYWSSVNPETFSGYQQKLNGMAAAIHARGGLWIAPAAPGFDARLIGGSRVVDRLDGQTLQTQLQVAFNSTPDAIGLISWNEFSENTHIEPSQNYAMRYLEVLADFNEVYLPVFDTFNSSDPPPQQEGGPSRAAIDMRGGIFVAVSGAVLLFLLGLTAIQRRK